MTKAEIVTKIAKKTGVDKAMVLAVVENFMDEVKDIVAAGDEVTLRGFGTFLPKLRAQKLGRIIKEDKGVVIPAHNIPFFKPCDAFKEMMAPKLQNQEA